ncbi:hypothetical protein F2Q70_00029037 [Brassica cretica]|uniref:Uncharacterized protein n=2 Tax=Brassica cretica TaxID=69181 RepID=A0A8S9FIZ3_BRACR|nr:hypothetical protein F2Q70_00029037 [Brassica cretica]
MVILASFANGFNLFSNLLRPTVVAPELVRSRKWVQVLRGNAELQKQIDSLQSQITDMHQAWETTRQNPDLSSEVQSLKEKLDEHSKQLEQSAEKLSQVKSANTVLRDQNQALKTAGNKKRRFNTRVGTSKGVFSVRGHGGRCGLVELLVSSNLLFDLSSLFRAFVSELLI